MRILALIDEAPWPAVTGYRIRCWELLSRLAGRHDVRLVVPVESVERAEAGSDAWRRPFTRVRFVRGRKASVGSLVTSLVSQVPHHASLRDGAALRRVLAEEAADCDVAYVHYLYFARPWLSCSDRLPPAVLDQHNLDHETWDTHAQAAGNPVMRAWLRRQARLVRADEARFLPAFAAILSVSEPDAQATRALSGRAEVSVAPNGADPERFRPVPRQRPGRTVLFPATSARRNVEGLAWFLREAWPRVLASVPDAGLLVAGSLDPGRLPRQLRNAARVTFTGPRDDLQFAFDLADVAVVPVRTGGGTKLKTFECLASGLPVVAAAESSRGCCSESDGVFARIGAKDFAEALAGLLRDDARRAPLAQAARRHAIEAHDWGKIARDVELVLQKTTGFGASGAPAASAGDGAADSRLTLRPGLR